MADVSVINVTSLTPIVAAAIVSGQQVTIYDNGGIAYRAPIEDVVAAAQTLNGCLCVQSVSITIPTAEVKTLYTIPKPFGLTVPTGFYIKPIGCDVFMTYNSATYVAAGSIQLWNAAITGDALMTSTAGLIEWTNNTSFQLTTDNATLSAIQIYDGSDLAILITVANPTTGDSDLKVVLTYILLPTP